jgi:hypothetical protein
MKGIQSVRQKKGRVNYPLPKALPKKKKSVREKNGTVNDPLQEALQRRSSSRKCYTMCVIEKG